jgi:uncharacterized protein
MGVLTAIPSSLSGALAFNNTFTILMGADKASLVDVTKLFPPMTLVSIHYSDPISFQADTLDLILPDIGDQIISSSKIKKGIWLSVKIDQFNRDFPGSHTQRDLGTFQIDQIKQRGPPSQTSILATSVPISSQIKLTIQNRIIFTSSLKDVLTTVANENGLTLLWDVSDPNKNKPLSQVEQWNESDLTLVAKLCKQAGLAMKVVDEKLVVFDEQEYELKPSVYTIDFAQPGAGIGMTSWELTTQSQDIFNTAQVSNFDPDSSQLVTAKATDQMQTSGSGEQHNSTALPYLPPKVSGEDIGSDT